MNILLKILVLFIFYIYGSIPFGLIFVKKTKGVDIRKVGSGNIGATNVLRVAGFSVALFSGLFDLSKGLIPVLICKYIFHFEPIFLFLSGFSGVLGHDFSIFLKFKGGKGIASSLGMIIGLNPVVAMIEIFIFIITLIVKRIVSISSIVSLITLPFVFLIFKNFEYSTLSILLSILGILRHKDNIERIIFGVESKFGEKEKIRETKIFSADFENIDEIKKFLENGGIGIIPTDTVYGLCCNALNKDAIKRVYKIKKRDLSKPLVLFVKDEKEIERYGVVDESSRKIIEKFIPGETTIVLKKKDPNFSISLKKFDTLGFRIPKSEFIINLLKSLDFPLATTSANISGEKTPTNLDGLKRIFNGVVDFIVDGGELGGVPSTVVEVVDGNINVLREGKIKKEEIINILKE
ncbi:MAG: L-threonylcarbamoyladenylate synthase [Caldisericia bacterium]|jgi:glycerol-3-phosphate acyltransferase PlsY|nr:L-threonylcarbamoyladenylate synthase [Caldisericia bacterium]